MSPPQQPRDNLSVQIRHFSSGFQVSTTWVDGFVQTSKNKFTCDGEQSFSWNQRHNWFDFHASQNSDTLWDKGEDFWACLVSVQHLPGDKSSIMTYEDILTWISSVSSFLLLIESCWLPLSTSVCTMLCNWGRFRTHRTGYRRWFWKWTQTNNGLSSNVWKNNCLVSAFEGQVDV